MRSHNFCVPIVSSSELIIKGNSMDMDNIQAVIRILEESKFKVKQRDNGIYIQRRGDDFQSKL